MLWINTISEAVRIITLLACVNHLLGGRITCGTRGEKMYGVMVLAICVTARYGLDSRLFLWLLLELGSMIIYTRLRYKKQWIASISNTLFAMAVFDVAKVIVAIVTFPILRIVAIHTSTVVLDAIVLVFICLAGILTVVVISKVRYGLWENASRGAQFGRMLICAMIEFLFLFFKTLEYNPKDIVVYRSVLFAIFFVFLILILWFWDKKAEEQRMRELLSYTHKTREVIPTLTRALDQLRDGAEQEGVVAELANELRAICNEDVKERKEEIAAFKTFDSTGSLVLDEQLKRYLEEANEQGFCLDIIVRAPVCELLKSNEIDRYQIMQLLGDLYRNAYNVIMKMKCDGKILICFGYNAEDFYEIAIYDNGEPFSKYIIEHLGQRGITTDGTGHGLADVMHTLTKSKGSFVLEQNLEKKNIFTKGIRIIFNEKKRVEIHVR